MSKKQFDLNLGSLKLNLQTGILAPQANSAVLATVGKTVILATVALGRPDPTKDYFPLSVEFMDKLYAGGIIKSSRWLKREGGLVDSSILAGRLIDRSIRPLFPEGFTNEVQVLVTVLSNDKNTDLIIPAFMAVSTALSLSDIPFNGPVSAVRVVQNEGKLVSNPDLKTLSASDLDLLVCVGPKGINMIEAGAKIVDNKTMLSAIKLAETTGQQQNKEISAFADANATKKIEYTPSLPSDELIKEVDDIIKKDVETFLENGADDGKHMAAENVLVDKVLTLPNYQTKIESEELLAPILVQAVHAVIKNHLRARTLKGLRFDGRKVDEVRPLSAQVGILPCTHGSAFFQRGLTQALTITTLSSLRDELTLQDSNGESTRQYMHFYSAPPFSTGEAGRIGRPGRREVGHGALAEKALEPVIPTVEEFPYTILLNSEVLSQNGSSSMASTCGSTLSLMDAGVPIKDKVAGISIGMVSDDKKYQLLTDIAGIEDHCGDMDFKITGTRLGVTAIQLDIKCQGLTFAQIEEVFTASTKARLQILDLIDKTLASPRPQLSEYAPKIVMVKIDPDKIGEVVGSGGKTIKGMMEQYKVQIDIDDDGKVSISGLDEKALESTAFHITSMVRKIETGEEFDGVVTRVEDYGVFVEFLPGREALVHVSELSGGFLQNVSQIIKVGDKIHVVVIGFNDNHQIKLSAPQFKADHPGSASTSRDQQPVFDRQPRFNKFDPNLQNRRRPPSRSGGNRVSR